MSKGVIYTTVVDFSVCCGISIASSNLQYLNGGWSRDFKVYITERVVKGPK